MHTTLPTADAISGLKVGQTASAKAQGAAKLTTLHRETVASLPQGHEGEIRVLSARLEPGDVTPRHSHRFPVTVCVHEGVFTLELDGRPPLAIGAGEVFVEPAKVAMTGRNLGTTPAVMTLFYVCEAGVPFADPVA